MCIRTQHSYLTYLLVLVYMCAVQAAALYAAFIGTGSFEMACL